MAVSPFNGFTKETIQFFTDLSANNNKEWFVQHKPDYDRHVLAPARDLVLALGERLRTLSLDVAADPRVNKSIFRIYRDVRFSKDKTPYKTNLALWFPVGQGGGKFENPGYYFHLDAGSLMLGVGIHGFSKPLLKAYREAVIDPELGPILAVLVAKALEKGYGIGQKTYKRVPQGYDVDHPQADLLRYSGLTAGVETAIPTTLYSSELVDHCFMVYQDFTPIVDWLLRMKVKAGL